MCEVSVIVPVYNVEPYLDRCMQSILGQTYTNIEIILVDDESIDNSNTMCLTYKTDPRVVVVHGSNQGLSGARNAGLDIAHGKYVVFIDSDDYVESTMIENMYNCMTNSNVDTVICGFRRRIGNKIEIRENKFSGRIYDNTKEIKDKVLKKMLGTDGHDYIEMSVWKCMFSMEIIKNNHLRFPDKKYISEDIIFDFDYYSKSKKLAMSDDTGYCYCLNEESLTQIYQKNKPERIAFQVAKMRSLAKKMNFNEEAYIRINYYYLANLIHHMKTMVSHVDTLGRKQCLCEVERVCECIHDENILCDKLNKCFKGRSKIAYSLIEYKNYNIFYYYLKINYILRKLIRGY